MRARIYWLLTTTLAVPLAAAAPAAAQAWDAPSFMPPRPDDEISVYVVDPPFGDWGLVGIWRQTGDLSLGVRGGLLDHFDDGTAFVLGSEFFGSLLRSTRDTPLEAAWVLGAGATFNTGTLLRVPAGVSVGARLGAGGAVFVPYVHPRAALEVLAVDDESVTELAVNVDLGVDVAVGRSFALRAAYSFVVGGADLSDGTGFRGFADDDQALGIGLVIRTGRGVEVR